MKTIDSSELEHDEGAEPGCVHDECVSRARAKMPNDETLGDLGEFFKTFGDSTRIRIVAALIAGELCVHDIAAVLDLRRLDAHQDSCGPPRGRALRARHRGRAWDDRVGGFPSIARAQAGEDRAHPKGWEADILFNR